MTVRRRRRRRRLTGTRKQAVSVGLGSPPTFGSTSTSSWLMLTEHHAANIGMVPSFAPAGPDSKVQSLASEAPVLPKKLGWRGSALAAWRRRTVLLGDEEESSEISLSRRLMVRQLTGFDAATLQRGVTSRAGQAFGSHFTWTGHSHFVLFDRRNRPFTRTPNDVQVERGNRPR
jgi:hypothetical protein